MWRRRISNKPLEEVLTERATHALDVAKQKAAADGMEAASADHIMHGLIHLNAGVGVHALRSLGASLDALSRSIERSRGDNPAEPSQAISFDHRAQEVIRLARLEASDLGHRYVGTEHIVLGLLRENRSLTAAQLHSQGIELARVRQHILGVLRGPKPANWA
ncbi:hypothetical protein LDL08_09655 [Nonomuraea glycinis]|nr:hypothetical protein [Nonomuraea glycinis]